MLGDILYKGFKESLHKTTIKYYFFSYIYKWCHFLVNISYFFIDLSLKLFFGRIQL